MNTKEKEPKIVHRIIDKDSGEAVGSYSRAYHDVYDFDSVYAARRDNCHGMFMDEGKYRIAKYKVTYELIEEDCDVDETDMKHYTEERDKYHPIRSEEYIKIRDEMVKMFQEELFNKDGTLKKSIE